MGDTRNVQSESASCRFLACRSQLRLVTRLGACTCPAAVVEQVIDGDTIYVRDSVGELRHVRINWIDAPEPGQKWASKSGEGLLIVGASGGGKSSLLRAIAGLWDSGNGNIIRPPLQDMFFLPQRPYMLIGTLRSDLLYPNVKKEVTDDELHDVLKAVNLADLAERFGGLEVDADWGKILSLGEQQRVAFARVLLSKPRYVILDEATSALIPRMKSRCISSCMILGRR